MCNQFRLPNLKQIQQYLKSDLDLPLVTPNFDIQAQDIFPNQVAPVLLYQNGQLQLNNKKWGYPSPVDPKKPLFNARIERFYDSAPSMWDKSFAKQRCLILTEKFFEYAKTTHIAENGRKYHDSYAFRTNQPLTLIAGIYDQDYFSMVTTAPHKDMAPIHNRMPLVVMPNELRRWLFQNFTSLIDRKSVDLQIEKMLK
ncbi:SOS response-associated peptidase [Lactobacillus crispatus]|uniref:SOS response-associated peptidase n=1 Tax=Lactobacillus crispatus TaxID=47770 RepID=UPI0030F7CD92